MIESWLKGPFFPFGFFLFFILVAGVTVAWGIYQDRKRRDAFRRFALQRGFECGDTRLSPWPSLPIFQKRKFSVRNVLRRGDLVICDGSYTVKAGKNRKTYRQTFVLREVKTGRLPAMTVEPEGFGLKLLDFVGGNDVDFEDQPEFSKKFWVKGESEESVRAFLHPGRIGRLMAYEGVHVEAGGSWIAFYRKNRLVPVEGLDTFLREGESLLSGLC